jgi:hypothetical protein
MAGPRNRAERRKRWGNRADLNGRPAVGRTAGSEIRAERGRRTGRPASVRKEIIEAKIQVTWLRCATPTRPASTRLVTRQKGQIVKTKPIFVKM